MVENKNSFGKTLWPFCHLHEGANAGWMDGLMDGQMDGWTDGWMDGWCLCFLVMTKAPISWLPTPSPLLFVCLFLLEENCFARLY